ncbi:MAG: hypothetical protein IJH34_16590 [Romboutsia sp.]|nr:hypothetical protein [Romboutsia sp.]
MKNNQSILERLSYHLNEEVCEKLEALIRKLISDEQDATASYLKAAHKVREKAEEKGDSLGLKIAKVFEDIANEEKVHIGELQKCLDQLGVSNKEELDGEKEASEML